MYYIYILYSYAGDKYYVGYTNDYERRLIEHNTLAQNTFTSKYRPWQIKAVFSCGEVESVAMKIEKFIKNQKSKKLIERMITGEQLTGMLDQLVRVPYVRD
jgi:putative endonuclease